MIPKEKKAILSWSLYDFANSAFATTVMAGFFPIFFKGFWSHGTAVTTSTAQLGIANSLASLLIALFAPFLGALADQGHAKKAWLFVFSTMGCVMTASLYLVSKGEWMIAIATYIVATIGFSCSNIFYDSLLVEVAPKDKFNQVSTLGYSLGYLGGGILFSVNVLMTLKPSLFGLASSVEAVKLSFVMVAIWWAVFSIPLFLGVKEPRKKTQSIATIIKESITDLLATIKELKIQRHIVLFLFAFWLYIDGVNTIIRMAVDYGLSIGFPAQSLIVALLLIQFIGLPATLVFGKLSKKINAKKLILFTIGIYGIITLGGAFMTSITTFYLLATGIGLVQGGLQALSRSFYANLIPKEKSAKYFGLYNMVGKFAAIIGPIFIAITVTTLHNIGLSPELASRFGISSILILFISGGVCLYYVKTDETQSS